MLVTGGASGIGATVVAAFCRQGSRVTFLDIDDDEARSTIAQVMAQGLPAPRYVRCNLMDVEALRASVKAAADGAGPIQVLINNAADDERRDWRDVTPQDWDRQMNINLRQQFFAIQAVAGAMAEAGRGSIVNLGSIVWKLGLGGLPCYTSAKSAIVGLTRSFARDLGPLGIRVNSVLPGAIMTRKQVKLRLTPESERAILDGQCLKRLLVPEDVAPIVLFLAADDSGACTNQNYVVDGGWT